MSSLLSQMPGQSASIRERKALEGLHCSTKSINLDIKPPLTPHEYVSSLKGGRGGEWPTHIHTNLGEAGSLRSPRGAERGQRSNVRKSMPIQHYHGIWDHGEG